jgi:inner membrane protein
MDLFSHALLPYLLGSFFKRNKQEITAFVIGGIAPDFDISILWIQYLYPTFFLITHRGLTHSLFFGFFTALIILYLATRDKVKTLVRRFVDFEPTITPRTVAFAYAGIIIHLFLDYTTTRGVPLFFPFDVARYSAEVFFYTDIYLTILSLGIIIFLYKKPLQRESTTKFLVVFLVIFAALGTVRIAEKTSAEDFFKDQNEQTFPTTSIFDWYVVGDYGDKIKIYEYNELNRTSPYNVTVPKLNIMTGGENLDVALHAAGEIPQVKMFEWRAYTVAINASFGDGAWSLEYYDPVQRAMAHGSPAFFRRAASGFGSVKVKVEGDRVTVQ